MRRALFIVGAVLASLPASAQESGPEERARELFDEAFREAAADRHAEAAALYRRSHSLFPHPGTLLNLALAEEAAGRRGLAHDAWTELLERYGTLVSDAARRTAQEHLVALEATLGRVDIVSEPEGASITVDGHDAGPAPLVRWLDPGPHRIEARLDGHRAEQREVVIDTGARAQQRFTLRPDAPAPRRVPLVVDGRDAAPAPPVPPTESFEDGPWPWILGAAGAVVVTTVAIVIAVVLGSSSADWRLELP